MTNDPLYHHLRELSWLRALTPAEQARLRAWLAAHPEAQADWEAETGLTEALDRLPNVPVATNFTARVVAAVQRENIASKRVRGWTWRVWLRGWLPRAAVAGLALGAGLFSYHAIQANDQRREMARSLRAVYDAVAVSDTPSPPDTETLADFVAIQASSRTSLADDQLLLLLK